MNHEVKKMVLAALTAALAVFGAGNAAAYTVTFDLGEYGMRVGGGELVQEVDKGDDAVAPDVACTPGHTLWGWDVPFTNVQKDLTVTALYDAPPPPKVEVTNLEYAPRADESGLADINFKVTSDVGGTNLVFEVAAYSKDRATYFTDGDISVDNGQTYTQDVLEAFETAGATQEVHLVWNWQKHNPDLDWDDVTIEVTAKVQGEDVAVKCQNGIFVGVRDSLSGVVAFKSVPYAKPPTKETGLRWKPPMKPDDSDAVVSARHFGPAAAQTREAEHASCGPVSEDCLRLSIWTAGGFEPTDKRPVMFYIHGGSYGWGGMCDPLYDGERLVRDNPDVILVSCDYRLNAFGYLDLTGLPGYDPEKHKDYDQAPNLGILDLQAGLRWVQENIAQFGGDPENVTIFGESAGGGSVSCLLQAKGSDGLFRRAIVMSGTLDLTDSPETYKASNQAYCLMKAAGKSNIDELLACSTEELVAALETSLDDPSVATVRHLNPREGLMKVAGLNNRPMCDDVRGIVASDPFAASATNAIAKGVDVMIGTTSEENNYWASLMFGFSREGALSLDDPLGYYHCTFVSNSISRSQTLFARVGNETNVTAFLEGPGASHPFDLDPRFNLGGLYPNIWGRTELMSELSFRIPSIIMAERHGELVRTSGGAGKTYMYYFCRPQKSITMPWVGACHASELTSVFKNTHLDVDGADKGLLAERVSGAFVSFAKTGNPGENWAEYDTTDRKTTVIGRKGDFEDAELRIESDPDGMQRELLEPDFLAYRAEKLRTGDATAFWHGLRHVAPYLHEIWYDDYVFCADGSCFTTGMVSACSSVRKGNFHGRNMDYFLWDSPEFVVHVAAKPSVGRLASVGVARQSAMRESGVLAGTYRESYETLPNWILDGVNEKRVVVNCNVVPQFDCGALPLENPDPNSTLPLHVVEIPRYLLDYATNAAHAVELLQGRILFGSGGGNYLLHFMVSDPNETLVIEIINGQVVARHQDIMTNFNVNWDNETRTVVDDSVGWDRNHFWSIEKFVRGTTDVAELKKLYTPCAMGIERYGELLANYDKCGQSLDEMMALMRRVQYTKMYDKSNPHFWYSEWCEYDEEIRNEDFYSMSWSWGDGSKLDEWIQSGLDAAAYDLADFERARTNLAERSQTWITGHACAYDIEKRMFRMIVQEDYEHTYDFWLVEPAHGSEQNPWQLGPATNRADTVAWTNGTTLVVVAGSGAVTNAYTLTEGQYIVAQTATLQRPDGVNWNGRVEVNCLVFDPAAGAQPFGSNIKLGLTASAQVKHLHRIANDVVEYDDMMLNLTGAPQFVTLIWDAALDGVEEGEVGAVTATASEPSSNPDCSVEVLNGTFVGVLDGETKIRSWKGIPYAAQPTGVNRWKAMGDPEVSSATKSAKQFGHAAIQPHDPSETGGFVEQGDDCLVLNVWSTDPGVDVGCDWGKRPVMVYIHGGAFVLGGSADLHYDGRNIVERNKDIVVVTINYRVGLMGFIDLKSVPGGEAFADSPNLAILDQRQALKWVHDNIERFGGDKDNVTIFGESAGGGSVAVHLTAPESAPYFRRAIQMSGGLDLTMTEKAYEERQLTRHFVAAAAKLRFGNVAMSNLVDMALLQSLTADEIRDLMETPYANFDNPGYDLAPDDLSGGATMIGAIMNYPMCDVRGVVPKDPFNALAQSVTAGGKDYMVGSTCDEWRYFMGYDGPDDPLRNYYTGLISDRMRQDWYWFGPEHQWRITNFLATVECELDEMDTRYPDIWKKTALEDLLAFRFGAIRMAEIHAGLAAPESGEKGKTYMYRFDKGRVYADRPWAGAGHACEVDYVFGNTSCVDGGPIDENLANAVNAAFVNFARCGDPNGDGGSVGGETWDEYDESDRKTMLFKNDCTTACVGDPDGEARELLMPAFDTYTKARSDTERRTKTGLAFVREPEPPKGTADDPWQIGKTAADDVIAFTNAAGKLFVEGTGDIRDFYALGGGLWFGETTVEAEFGAGVKSIGANMLSTCSGLERIVMYAEEPPELGETALPSSWQLDAIYVPENSYTKYVYAWPEEYAYVIQGAVTGSEELPWKIGVAANDTLAAYTNGTGRLSIVGEGAMAGFDGPAPWAGEDVTECLVAAGVTEIGKNAFAECSELDTLVLYAETPPLLGAGNDLAGLKIFVPAGAADDYRAAWPMFAGQIDEMRSGGSGLTKHLYEIEYKWWDATRANDVAEELAEFMEAIDWLAQIYRYIFPYEFFDWYEGVANRALCTSCRNGNFIGRNFDWGYDDVDECVMRIPAAEGRLASVGVASRFFPQLLQDAFGVDEFLPELTMDGVNEKGVAINVNVVPGGDNGWTTGTNHGAKRLCAGFAVRTVLDHATNAAHAVEILQSRDIYSLKPLEFHWMISDATESYVVECVSNALVVLKAKNARPKMANFYVSHSPNVAEYEVVSGNEELTEDEHTPHAMGIERYASVSDGLESVDSVEVMFTRMTNVWYKAKYLPGNEERFWSDLNGAPVPGMPGENFEFGDETIAGRFDDRLNAFKQIQANYVAVTNYEAQFNSRTIDPVKAPGLTNGVVHTVHTSIYDIEKRMFRIAVQEDYVHTFNFWLVESARVTLPAGVPGFTYVVSNLTAGAEAKITPAETTAGGATYELPMGAKIAIYAVPAAGYVVTGTNPYVIDEVTPETTLEDVTLPQGVKIVAADTVVYGTIRTSEKGNSVAEAIAIKDGKYVYVGDGAGAAAFIEDGVTTVVDHRGKGMVMPGCTDGHSHYAMKFGLANMKGGVMFAPEDDKAEVLEKLRTAAEAAKAAGKKSLFGFGWNIVTLVAGEDEPPTLKELDDATNGEEGGEKISMVILDSGGHHAFCNSECLLRCGIIDGEGGVLKPEIEGGYLELDESGYPTGYAEERAMGYLMRMGGIDYDELMDDEVAEISIRKTRDLLLSTGYTAALEGWSNILHSNKLYAAAMRLDENGELNLVFPMTYEVEPWMSDAEMTNQIDYLASLNETYATGHVQPKYLKIFMDGVVETKTGAMLMPYKDDHEYYRSFWSTNRLADITRACNAKDLTVHVHTMGDAAIRDTVTAYIMGGDGTHRNCLVHLRNVSTNEVNDFERMAANNIACSAGFTWHVRGKEDELMESFLEKDYIEHAYPIKSFFDAGVKVSSHSDYPANEPCPQDPFGLMEVALTGQRPDLPEDEKLAPYDTNELVTVEQVFEALTINGAWQLGLENERGSIKVGKWADFVLADQDVFECATNDIHKTKVVSTWFEGEKVYGAAPLTVKNVTTATHWPWDAKIDITCDLTGTGVVQLAAALLTNGVTVCEATNLTGRTEINLDDAGGATNGVMLVWNAKRDCPADFNAADATVVVTAKREMSSVSSESEPFAFDVRTQVALAEGAVMIADVSYNDTYTGVVAQAGVTLGCVNTKTGEQVELMTGLSGAGVTNVALPAKDGAYMLTHVADSRRLISFVTFTVSGCPKYSTKITLDPTGGTGGTKTVTATYGKALPSASAPTRRGYMFSGYFDATNGGRMYYDASMTSQVTWWSDRKTYTLYAQWARISTVTINKAGGTSGTSKVIVTNGVMPRRIGVPTREGYALLGIFNKAEGGAKYWNADGRACRVWNGTAASYTFYAHWARVSTVTINKAGGGPSGTSKVIVTNGVMPRRIGVPTREGYALLGIFNKAEGGAKYWNADGRACRVWNGTAASYTFYAQWTRVSSIVTIDKAGGTSGTSKVIVTNGVMPRRIGVPTREGYALLGIFNKAEGGAKYWNADGTGARVWNGTAASYTFYAHWARVSTVTIDKAGGTSGTSKVIVTNGVMPCRIDVPTREGYALLGIFNKAEGGAKYWNADGTGARVWNGTAASYTFYAQWLRAPYDITVKVGGELAPDESGPALALFDGDAETGWMPAGTATDWDLFVTYGEAVTALDIEVAEDVVSAEEMWLYVSEDASDWTPIGTEGDLPATFQYLWLHFEDEGGVPPHLYEITVAE